MCLFCYSQTTFSPFRLALCWGCLVTFLLSFPVTNHSLLTIPFCCAKVVKSIDYIQGDQVGSQGTQKGSPKIHLSISKQILLTTWCGPGSFQGEYTIAPLLKSLLFCIGKPCIITGVLTTQCQHVPSRLAYLLTGSKRSRVACRVIRGQSLSPPASLAYPLL